MSGAVDKASQRVVWHTGGATDTMLEANLNGLTQDHTPVLVHFPSGTTQTWLLVRLPSPGSSGTRSGCEPRGCCRAGKVSVRSRGRWTAHSLLAKRAGNEEHSLETTPLTPRPPRRADSRHEPSPP